MKARAKLITLWFGDLPKWFHLFKERIEQSTLVDWELIQPRSVGHVNFLADIVTGGNPCHKGTPYALCDLRPMFGEMYGRHFEGYEWWGWCDLDIVVGDLDRLLKPMLDKYDIISTDAHEIHGAMTLLRNTDKVNTLYQATDAYKGVMTDPNYCNFDESGFNLPGKTSNKNPSFTRIVKEAQGPDLRVMWDDRSWSEGKEMLGEDLPSRSCQLLSGRLFEYPVRREIILYHFMTDWPLPNKHAWQWKKQMSALEKQTNKEANSEEEVLVNAATPEYWDKRVEEVVRTSKHFHVLAYDTTSEHWTTLRIEAKELLLRYIPPNSRILDAGCGYGALLDSFAEIPLPVDYVGIDFSPSMIELAKGCRANWVDARFVLGDVRGMPFADEFDWCICRGIEGTTRTLLGNEDWNQMVKEMLRVAKRVLVMDLNRGHRVIERGNK